MARTPTDTSPTQRRSSGAVALALLGLCLSLLALRTTYTEAPVPQSLALPGNVDDAVYSLTVSGLLIFALVFWLLWQVRFGRAVYRVTGIEIGLVLFLLAAAVSTFGASDKRQAINHAIMLAAPACAAVLLVQVLDGAAKVRAVLLIVAALGVVSAYQCAEQFLMSNAITIEQYEKSPEMLLGPLGIEPGTFQHFLFEHRLYSQGIRGFFTTGNSAASFAMLAAFAGLALLLSQRRTDAGEAPRSRCRWYPIVAMLLILAGLALTRSKGGILAFVIAAALFALLALLRRRLAEHRRAAWIVSAATLLVVSLAVGSMAVSYGLRHGRLPGGNSMLVRWQYWHATAQMVADHPVAGIGLGNFAQNYTRYKPASAPESVSDPHNFPLSLLAQCGPLGLLGFLAMIVIPLYRATVRAAAEPAPCGDRTTGAGSPAIVMLWAVSASFLLLRPLLIPASWGGDVEVLLYEIAALYLAPAAAFLIGFFLFAAGPQRRSDESDLARVATVRAALGCAVAGVLVHNLVDFAIFEPGVWSTLWTVMACFIALGHRPQPLASVALPTARPLRWIAPLVGLVLLGAYIHFVWRPVYGAIARTEQGRRAAAVGRFDRAHALLDAAAALDPLSATAPSINGRLYLQRAAAGQAPLLEKAAENLRKAMERDPADYKHYERAGDVATLAGQYEEAQRRYAEAADRYPGSGRLQLRLAQVAERLGDTDGALRHYRKAVEIEDAFREQFRRMYPERTSPVSRLGQENYELARRRAEELGR
ncbi:O-antigen ligase family protein [Anaerobaca lacustris]|uniref:O-antigen ligase family protein n=1 Tax=Anaerobaca lacustris TaxID=3044600 RepID=A0AAW6U1N1_9BACT|nr:O-antigen ligase family protein [Sedimentisphaerales bacterium M17dextr]